jgi:hypothetical protein
MHKKFLALFVIWLLTTCVLAQAMADNKADATAPKIIQPLPFKAGESLNYEVRFSKLIFSGAIGEITLNVINPTDALKQESGGPELIELKAEAVSKGFFPSLFGLKVKNLFKAVVNKIDFGIHSSIQLIEEGKVRREKKAVFDRQTGRVIYTERNLNDALAKPTVKEEVSPAWMLDMLSAIYYLRTQKFESGSVIPVPVSEAGKVYNIDVVVGKREEVKVDAGKFNAVKLDVKAFDGRYVKRKGEMQIWVTDDERRIPVRAKIKASGATVTIDLKRMPEFKS